MLTQAIIPSSRPSVNELPTPTPRHQVFLDALENLGIALPTVPFSAEHLVTTCPFCGQRESFHIDFTRVRWACTAGCGAGGLIKLHELIERLRRHRRVPDQPPDIIPRGPEENPERAEAAEKGLQMLLEAAWGAENDWIPLEPEIDRVITFLHNVREGWGRCGRAIFYRRFVHKLHGDSYQPLPAPCHEPGHERCAWHHAKYDLQKWRTNFDHRYGSEPLAVLKFDAPGYGPRALRDVVGRFKGRRLLRQLLGGTIGVLTPTATGAAYLVLVRKKDVSLLPWAERIWKELVPDGFVKTLTVAANAKPLEVAAELRCQAEQSLFLLVASGELSPQAGLNWLAEALGMGGRPAINRVVFGPGFRSLPKQIDPALGPGSAFSLDEAEEALMSAEFESAPFSSSTNRDVNPTYRENLRLPTQDELCELSRLLARRGLTLNDWLARQIDELSWEPCRVCHRPDCGQRPVTPERLLHFTKIEDLVRKGKLIPVKSQEEGEVVAYIPTRDVQWANDGRIYFAQCISPNQFRGLGETFN